jgi:ATPase subunit of ABC transporter with duplicated ATPase domains
MTAAIVCSDLSFSWPDGTPVLSGLTTSFGPGRTGLIGVNGSGKSTLDLDARERLYDAVACWTGVMVIVSHDRELLGLVDQIADLSAGSIRMYGGNLLACEELLAAEQAAAERAVSAAEADVRRERRDLVSSQTKQARRDRQGRKLAESTNR